MNDCTNLVRETLEDVRKQIAENIVGRGLNATGKTIASMTIELRGITEGTLYGRKYFDSLEKGVKPNKRNHVSYNFHDAIEKWLIAKGLTHLNAWSVAWNIDQHGTRTFREGGRKDIYTPAIENAIDNLSDKLSTLITSIID